MHVLLDRMLTPLVATRLTIAILTSVCTCLKSMRARKTRRQAALRVAKNIPISSNGGTKIFKHHSTTSGHDLRPCY
jgi:hypothetical protein